MARYTLFNNESIRINVPNDVQNVGWSVVNGTAVHESCNAGFINMKTIVTEPGKTYKITYTVLSRDSGGVYVSVGGSPGGLRTSAGKYTESIEASNNSGISFWSDGDLSIADVIISEGTIPGTTITFNDKYKAWTGYKSYVPSHAIKFLDRVMLFKEGTMWEQWTNPIHNNFFGEQYNSEIVFYINTDNTLVKTLGSIRIVGNVPWNIKEVYVRPRAGKERGQYSRLKEGNFKSLQGQWFADFLRDMKDPRFSTEEQALLEGALLQGEVIRITMESNETGQVRLLSVDTLSPDSQYSF